MEKRTEAEIQAYIDGYNDSYNQFMDCFKGRKNLMAAITKMKAYVEAVNAVGRRNVEVRKNV